MQFLGAAETTYWSVLYAIASVCARQSKKFGTKRSLVLTYYAAVLLDPPIPLTIAPTFDLLCSKLAHRLLLPLGARSHQFRFFWVDR